MTSVSKERVLNLAQELWAVRGEVTLDNIDGQFYWRVCRGILVDELMLLVKQSDELTDQDREEFGRQLSDLREQGLDHFELMEALKGTRWLHHQVELDDHIYRIEQEFPRFLDAMDRPLGMRGPLLDQVSTKPPSIPNFRHGCANYGSGIWCFIGIRDSQWRGVDVERALVEEIIRLKSSDPNFLTRNDSSTPMEEEEFVFLDFKFYGAGELSIHSDSMGIVSNTMRWVTVESPVIMCVASYPLPSAGVVASAYDTIAIEKHKWHTQLYGAGVSRNQTVEVAIRTWALGLLIGMGYRWRDASAYIDEILNQPISQAGFTGDRIELVKRVPEAQKFVYQRDRRL